MSTARHHLQEIHRLADAASEWHAGVGTTMARTAVRASARRALAALPPEALDGLKVSAYELVPPTHDGGPHRLGVTLVLVPGMHGDRWAIRHGTDCLSKTLEWEWEPMPSSRDDAFFARCRFESAETGARLWSAYLSALRSPA